MKITDVKAKVVTTGIPLDFREKGSSLEMEGNVVQVFTDEGITGTWFAWEQRATGRGMAETITAVLKPELVGVDPFDRERIWRRMIDLATVKNVHMIAVGAIDVCLWDIAGKVTNLPVYRMLGAYRDKVRAYASTTTLAHPQAYYDYGKQLVRRGYTAIKLHVFGDPHKDVEACQAMRQAVGPGVNLMLDSVGVYTRRDALWVGREIEKLNFYWYEEPLPDYDMEGYRYLRSKLDIPIAGTERLYYANPSHFVPYITHKVVDLVRTDARRGITLAKKVADLCDAFNMNCELHSWGSCISQAANLHVMCAIANCDFFEKSVPEEQFEVLANNPIRIDQDGFVHPPQGPGHGIELDWDEVQRRTTVEM